MAVRHRRAPLTAAILIVTAVNLALAAPADRIIHGGPIITVNQAQPTTDTGAVSPASA